VRFIFILLSIDRIWASITYGELEEACGSTVSSVERLVGKTNVAGHKACSWSLRFQNATQQNPATCAASALLTVLGGYLGIIGVLPTVQRVMEDLPVTERLLDAVQELRVNPMPPDKINVLVADLDHDDADGRNAAHVLEALEGQFNILTSSAAIRAQRAMRLLRQPPELDAATAFLQAREKGERQLESSMAIYWFGATWRVVVAGRRCCDCAFSAAPAPTMMRTRSTTIF
jgi:hypothetical protein